MRIINLKYHIHQINLSKPKKIHFNFEIKKD